MKAFCPNCGTRNEGMAGGRVTCLACTASFEVPREEGSPVTPPPPIVAPAPPPPPPPLKAPLGGQLPTGYVGPPPTGFSRGQGAGGTGPINTLSIVSLVCGLLCCFGLPSIAAVITGAIAQNQIAASNGAQRGREYALVGMVLGVAGVMMQAFFVFTGVFGRLFR